MKSAWLQAMLARYKLYFFSTKIIKNFFSEDVSVSKERIPEVAVSENNLLMFLIQYNWHSQHDMEMSRCLLSTCKVDSSRQLYTSAYLAISCRYEDRRSKKNE